MKQHKRIFVSLVAVTGEGLFPTVPPGVLKIALDSVNKLLVSFGFKFCFIGMGGGSEQAVKKIREHIDVLVGKTDDEISELTEAESELSPLNNRNGQTCEDCGGIHEDEE